MRKIANQLAYSTEDAANQLSVTVSGIEGWRFKGLLKPVKIGKLCYYTENELKRFLGLPDLATIEYMHGAKTVAAVLGVGLHTVDQLRKEGKLTALRAGRLWRYPESTINRFIGLPWAEEDSDRGGKKGVQADAQAFPSEVVLA